MKVERTLNERIARLDKEEKSLRQSIQQARTDVDRLVSETRARLKDEIVSMREADFPSMRGDVEKNAHKIDTVRALVDNVDHQNRSALEAAGKRLTALEKGQAEAAAADKADRERVQGEVTKLMARLDTVSGTVTTLAKSLGGRLEEHDKAFTRVDAETAKLAQQLDLQQRTVERTLADQLGQYGKSLADFKKALAGLGEKLVQEEQRSNDLATRLQGRVDVLTAKVDNDTKATGSHLTDVTKSVGTVKKALETVGGQIITRVEDQDRRIDDVTKSLGRVEEQDRRLAELTQHMVNLNKSIEAVQSQIVTLTQGLARVQEVREAPRDTAAPAPAEAAPRPSSPETPPAPSSSSLGPAGTPAASLSVGAATTREGYVKENYDRWLARFRQGDLDGALQGFNDFLAQYPSSELAPNAQYWMGECFYGKREFERAIEAFDRVKLINPASEKVPAALLKKGFAYLALKDPNRASSVWRQVVDGYPQSPEAGKAMEKLAQLKSSR